MIACALNWPEAIVIVAFLAFAFLVVGLLVTRPHGRPRHR